MRVSPELAANPQEQIFRKSFRQTVRKCLDKERGIIVALIHVTLSELIRSGARHGEESHPRLEPGTFLRQIIRKGKIRIFCIFLQLLAKHRQTRQHLRARRIPVNFDVILNGNSRIKPGGGGTAEQFFHTDFFQQRPCIAHQFLAGMRRGFRVDLPGIQEHIPVDIRNDLLQRFAGEIRDSRMSRHFIRRDGPVGTESIRTRFLQRKQRSMLLPGFRADRRVFRLCFSNELIPRVRIHQRIDQQDSLRSISSMHHGTAVLRLDFDGGMRL